MPFFCQYMINLNLFFCKLNVYLAFLESRITAADAAVSFISSSIYA